MLPTDWRLVRVGGDKRPLAGLNWFDVDDFSPDDAAALNGSGPPAWGLKTGPASGVVVLDLDAEGWRESFQEVTGHPITDLPPTISWTSGKPGRSGHAFQVDPDWWPHLLNRRFWEGANGETCWELRWDRHQAVIIGAHPETGSYSWLPGRSPHSIPDPAPAPDWLLEHLLRQEDASLPQVEPTAEDAARAVAMLKKIPAADFSNYDSWLEIGMALHHTDRALLTDWTDWSRQMPNFDEAECLAKWESFGKSHRGRPFTIRTLHHHAKAHGYKEPKRSRKQQQSQQLVEVAAPAPSAKEQQTADLPDTFRVLGWDPDRSRIYYQHSETGQIAWIKPAATAGTLMNLALLKEWEKIHSGERGVAWDSALSAVISAANKAGVFVVERTRGRGVWLDNNSVVWHLGDRLVVNGKPVKLIEQRSANHYPRLPALDINPMVEPLNDAEGTAILNAVKAMGWASPLDPIHLLGWVMLANVGGAIDKRPVLQNTSERGSGKTFVRERVLEPLLAGLAISRSGSTEAGIRQILKADALPVIIDESEGEDAHRRKGHLLLARLSYDGSPCDRGTTHGQALTYAVRSSVALSGINATITNPADRSRTVMVSRKFLPVTTWQPVAQQIEALCTAATGARLLRRAVGNLLTLRANVATFRRVVEAMLNGTAAARAGDTYGALLAGAHLLLSTAEVDDDAALAWLDAIGWNAEKALGDDTEDEDTNEGKQCLTAILTHEEPWRLVAEERGSGRISIRELVVLAHSGAGDEMAEAQKILGRRGIKWTDCGLVIANKAEHLAPILKGTRWRDGAHRARLLDIPGAAAAGMVRFPAIGTMRATKLPLTACGL